MNDDLDSKTEAELNVLFAREVVGLTFRPHHSSRHPDPTYVGHYSWPDGEPVTSFGDDRSRFNFCRDVNAVLPFLEQHTEREDIYFMRSQRSYIVENTHGRCYGRAESLGRAIVLALIRILRSQPNAAATT
jgi:hypothetical protein